MKKTMKKAKLLSLALATSLGSYAQEIITTWNVTLDSDGEYKITIPTHPGNSYSYDYDVDWGDGNGYILDYSGDATSPDYGSTVTKTVKIRPKQTSPTSDFPAFFFKKLSENDKSELTGITNWGGNKWETFASAFAGCSNLSSVPTSAPDLSSVDDMSFMFQKASSLNADLNNWDVSGVDYMRGMFAGATSFNGNIAGWNMSNVKDISHMFLGATAFNVDIGSWNTAAVTTMDGTFANAKSFNQELNWNTASVTSMNSTFSGACAFNQVLDWDIADVTDMNHMLSGSGLSGCIYTRTLEAWESGTVQSGVTLGADGLQHSSPSARANLISTSSWDIEGDIAVSYDVCRDPSWFVTEWTLTSPGTITIPVNPSPSYTYNYDVDWSGNGEFEPADIGYNGDATSATLAAGTYTVNIRGDFPAIYFNNVGDKELITSIIQWGDIEWETFLKAFRGCSNLEYDATDTPDLGQVTDLSYSFSNCSIFNGDIGDWNVSSVTNMAFMFTRAYLFNQEISRWDVSNVTDMNEMFFHSAAFNNGINSEVNPITLRTGLDGWDVSKVTKMSRLFSNATVFNRDIGSWDVRKVTTMANMFRFTNSFNQDLSEWELDALTNTSFMFGSSTAFNNGANTKTNSITLRAGIDGWDVSNVTDMSYMFVSASAFNRELSSWDVSSVTTMAEMFHQADAFNNGANTLTNPITLRIGLDGWDVSNVTNMYRLFAWTDNFNRDIGSWDVRKVTTMERMFSSAELFNQDLSDWRLDALTNTALMFRNAVDYTNGSNNAGGRSIDDWDVQDVTNMSYMFAGAISFDRDISSWNTASVTNMFSMFSGASIFNQDIGSWNVAKVENMYSMFSGASIFNQDISNWNVGAVETMHHMFSNTDDFDQDLNSWDVSEVTNMGYMFYNAAAFNKSLGNWNLGSIQDNSSTVMAGMLDNCGMGYTAYDATLTGWRDNLPGQGGTGNTPTGITLGAAGLYYCAAGPSSGGGNDAWDELDDPTIGNWTISDAGLDCTAPAIVAPSKNNNPAFNATNNQILQLSPNNNSPTKQKKSSVGNTSSNQISVNTLSNGNLLVKQTKPSAVNNQLTLEVFNLNGQRVYQASQSTTNNNFNLSNLAKGAYVVKITTNNKVETQKISIP